MNHITHQRRAWLALAFLMVQACGSEPQSAQNRADQAPVTAVESPAAAAAAPGASLAFEWSANGFEQLVPRQHQWHRIEVVN